jgi:SPX domain protein involved in polyphosphate accumulation
MNNALSKETYRHEIKYYINRQDAYLLHKMLANHMRPDENTNSNGEYWVRSLYFDTMDNSGYVDKINGCSERKKIRIRTYDTECNAIKLELKQKSGNYYKKESTVISKDAAIQLVNGNRSSFLRTDDKITTRCFACMQYEAHRPVILVDYEREAFVYPYHNIRITIDKSLRASMRVENVFIRDIAMVPVFNDERYVLEVKFNASLPGILKNIISGVNPVYTSVSKYCLARTAVHF